MDLRSGMQILLQEEVAVREGLQIRSSGSADDQDCLKDDSYLEFDTCHICPLLKNNIDI